MENPSENSQAESFYQYRSVTKCLSAGISFLTDNFFHLVKLTLPATLIFAAVLSGIVYIMSDSRVIDLLMNVGLGDIVASQTTNDFIITLLLKYGIIYFLCSLIYVVVYYFFYGIIYREIVIRSHDLPLHKFAPLPTYKIAAKYGLKFFCYSLAVGLLVVLSCLIVICPLLIPTEGDIFGYIKVGISAILLMLFIFFALPLSLAVPAMYLEKGKAVKCAFLGYKRGLKKWSKVFCLSVLISVLCISVMFILSLPSIVMINSYYAATWSEMNGDPVSFPAGFHFWYFVVLFITNFLYSFTLWIQTVPFAYLYASVKSDESQSVKYEY